MTQVQYLRTGKLTIGEVAMLILSPLTTPVALLLMALKFGVDLNKVVISRDSDD